MIDAAASMAAKRGCGRPEMPTLPLVFTVQLKACATEPWILWNPLLQTRLANLHLNRVNKEP